MIASFSIWFWIAAAVMVMPIPLSLFLRKSLAIFAAQSLLAEYENRLDAVEGRKVVLQEQALRFGHIRSEVLTRTLYEMQQLSDEAVKEVRKCRAILERGDFTRIKEVLTILELQGLSPSSKFESNAYTKNSPIGNLENRIQLAGAELIDGWIKNQSAKGEKLNFGDSPVPALASVQILAAIELNSRRRRIRRISKS